MDKCFFCTSVKQKDFLLENEYAIIRMDDYPVNKGHLEVITKRHIDTLFETTKEERNAIFELLEKGKLIIEEKYKPDGYNIGINQGTAAGQTIMHLHIHLIPRYKGDVVNPSGGVRGVIREKQNYWI